MSVVALFVASAAIAASESSAGSGGSYLRAKIDGKDWAATEVVPDRYWSEILQIQGKKGPVAALWLQLNMPAPNKVDKLVETGLNHYMDEQSNMYMINGGETQVTRMDAQWVEGTFHFTATDKRSKKTIQVTDGAFRVPRPKK